MAPQNSLIDSFQAGNHFLPLDSTVELPDGFSQSPGQLFLSKLHKLEVSSNTFSELYEKSLQETLELEKKNSDLESSLATVNLELDSARKQVEEIATASRLEITSAAAKYDSLCLDLNNQQESLRLEIESLVELKKKVLRDQKLFHLKAALGITGVAAGLLVLSKSNLLNKLSSGTSTTSTTSNSNNTTITNQYLTPPPSPVVNCPLKENFVHNLILKI